MELTEWSDILKWFRDLTEGQLTEVGHDGCFRELQVVLLGGYTKHIRGLNSISNSHQGCG